MIELLKAIDAHSDALNKWLDKPIPERRAFLSDRDARLVDFEAMDTWCEVLNVAKRVAEQQGI